MQGAAALVNTGAGGLISCRDGSIAQPKAGFAGMTELGMVPASAGWCLCGNRRVLIRALGSRRSAISKRNLDSRPLR